MTIPCMSANQVEAHIKKHGDWPSTEEMILAPTKWLRINKRNTTKWTLHYADNGVWRPTAYVKFDPHV